MNAHKQSTQRFSFYIRIILALFAHSAIIKCWTDARLTPEYSSLFFEPAQLDIIQEGATPIVRTHHQDKKPWTVIVYIAADNDLRGFAARNIKQMASVGSNEHINILVHLDIRIAGNQKITRRYYIENNRILHVNPGDPETERMDSGSPKTLQSCCKWAIKHYPADHYALIMWNHGTGTLDPLRGRILNPTQLFEFNPTINKFDIDRSIEFFDWVDGRRGICWDDTTGNYLTNQKLASALNHVCTKYLGGKKLSILAFDACLMSMIEVANIAQDYADIMVGSQEVELGTGYNYALAFEPFAHHALAPDDFAKQIVKAYEKSYSNITNDYTQSAMNLSLTRGVEQNINLVAHLLVECLKQQKNNSVKINLRRSRNKLCCTHFDEPRYVDLHHLYKNILKNMSGFSIAGGDSGNSLLRQLQQALEHGLRLIEKAVIANTAGRNLSQARGISIYFPEDVIHPSYPRTSFASTNEWLHFIQAYIRN